MATPDELHQAALKIGRANPEGRQGVSKYLKRLDYSVLQQCIHCGMCLPTCPTYDETKLERNGPRGRIAPPASIAQTVTYHEACHLCHGQKITRQPRQVLKAVPGLELVELPESAWCCGSAGIYNITQPEMSQKLLRRKMANIATTGAEVVASANPGCSVQLQAAVRESNLKLKVAHPISLLAQAYRSAKFTSSQQSLDALSG
jgi:Fe-S oxidoreductase